MKNVYLSLGSNMGDRLQNLQKAIQSIALLPETNILMISSVYETAPVGFSLQDNFYNAVIKIETTLSPKALLGACLGIEAALGRIRTIKNGPRTIDVDILEYESVTFDDTELTLPHKELFNRAFVLVPLIELCDDIKYKDALNAVDVTGVKRTALSVNKGD